MINLLNAMAWISRMTEKSSRNVSVIYALGFSRDLCFIYRLIISLLVASRNFEEHDIKHLMELAHPWSALMVDTSQFPIVTVMITDGSRWSIFKKFWDVRMKYSANDCKLLAIHCWITCRHLLPIHFLLLKNFICRFYRYRFLVWWTGY